LTSSELISGPVDFALIVFQGNELNGDVAPALVALEASGTVRVLDAAFVVKDAVGATRYVEVGDTEIGGAYADLQDHHLDLLNDQDLEVLAEGLEPNCSGLVLVWENTWAGRFAEAVRVSRGRLVAFERIPHDQVESALATVGLKDGGND
jgi:hypothetical protein